jgi:ABC-2 type transport system ATP-binding protein
VNAPPALRIEGLVVRYGEKVAVDGLTLSADAGEVVAVLGKNGAGKTTTIESAEGYRQPAAGTVRVLGLDPHDRRDRRRLHRRLGVMLQKGGIYPSIGAREALRLFASYYEDPLDPEALLERMGLEQVATTPWRRLSGGEQQRVSMGLALVGRPDVVFLDEPTAGVDPAGRGAIRSQVAALKNDGVCVVLTTHELEEAERMADRIVIVDRGRVAAEGTLAELTGDSQLRFSAPAAIDCSDLSAAVGATVSEEQPGEYRAPIGADPATVARLTAWLAEHDVVLTGLRTTSRLEEVFLRLTGGDE